MSNSFIQIIKDVAIIAGVLLLVGLFKFLVNRHPKERTYELNEYSFEAKQYFFSYSELDLYRLLSGSLPEQYDIFPKVRLLDLANTKYKINFSKIAQKHIDFLIVDKNKHCTPILAIELNGESHNTEKMEERDEYIGEFFEIINIPLMTIWNDELKNPEIVKEKISKYL